MKFRKSSNFHLVSDCGRYSIAKVIVQGVVQYEAWYVPELPRQPLALGTQQVSSLDCIGICRRHDEQLQKKTA